jgi:predicted RNase H-like HicB family nuclease
MKREFTVIVEQGENGYLVGLVAELPACRTQGKDIDELLERMKECIELVLEFMRDEGLPIPSRTGEVHKVAV